jgi:light-regulated signal transduction histidine kinase (bacteriophytochrome)
MQPEPRRPVDLGQVVAEVLSDLEERISDTNGRVHVGSLPTILASPLQMRQLFQNLIANALKFHPAGVVPEVHVDATPRGNLRAARDGNPVWEIRVRDNGIGFKAQHAERIFAPFQRLHGRQAYEGTGMGLAICRRIVALHDGTLTASSESDTGATFLITLRRTAAVPDAVAPAA